MSISIIRSPFFVPMYYYVWCVLKLYHKYIHNNYQISLSNVLRKENGFGKVPKNGIILIGTEVTQAIMKAAKIVWVCTQIMWMPNLLHIMIEHGMILIAIPIIIFMVIRSMQFVWLQCSSLAFQNNAKKKREEKKHLVFREHQGCFTKIR